VDVKTRNACISMSNSEGYRDFGSDGNILLRPLREWCMKACGGFSCLGIGFSGELMDLRGISVSAGLLFASQKGTAP
jgi:hypothetical protein